MMMKFRINSVPTRQARSMCVCIFLGVIFTIIVILKVEERWLSFKQRKDYLKDRGKMQTSLHPTQAIRDHGGTHFILLVEPMFVLVCLASLPGTPRRALDAAGLVLVWFWGFAMAGQAVAIQRCRAGMRTTIAKETCDMQRVL
jgi:hypothetical protein